MSGAGYTKEQMVDALQKAAKAGDVNAANEIAAALQEMDAASAPPPPPAPVAPTPTQPPAQDPSLFSQGLQNLAQSAEGTGWEIPATVGITAARLPARMAEGVARATGVIGIPEIAGKLGGIFGASSMPSGASGTQRVDIMPEPEGIRGELIQAGQPQTPEEAALLEKHDISRDLTRELPGALVGGPLQKGNFISKVVQVVGEGALGGQVGASGDFGERLDKAQADAGSSALFATAFGGTKKAFVDLAGKYIPGTKAFKQNLAYKELSRYTNLSPEDVGKMNREIKATLGPDAELLTTSQVTGSRALMGREQSFGAAATPEDIAKAELMQAKQKEALNASWQEFREAVPITQADKEFVDEAYTALSTTMIPPEAVTSLKNHEAVDILTSRIYGTSFKKPKVKSGEDVEKALKEAAKKGPSRYIQKRKELAGYPSNSVAYWDSLKRTANKLVYGGGVVDDAEEQVLKDFANSVNKIGDDFAGNMPEYALARSLSQRDILSRQLDKMFAPIETAGEVSKGDVRRVVNKNNWIKLNKTLDSISDKETRKAAKRHLELIKRFADMSDDAINIQSVAQTREGFDAGGIVPMVVQPVSTFLRGDYNAAALELLHNPELYEEVGKRVMAKEGREFQKAALELFSRVSAREYERNVEKVKTMQKEYQNQ